MLCVYASRLSQSEALHVLCSTLQFNVNFHVNIIKRCAKNMM